MKKRLLAICLSISLLFVQTSTSALISPFPDLSLDNPHTAAISYLESYGIIQGYSDGTFKPEATINRAEALKLVFLVRQELSLPDSSFSQPVSFSDVSESDWFFDYVEEAYNLGIVQGYSDGSFKPASEITAAESVKIIYTGLLPDLQMPNVEDKPFTDVSIDRWFAPYLQYGKEKHFVEPQGDGSFDPERNMTRAKFAEAIYRVMYAELNNLEDFPLSQNWLYCNNQELGYKIKRPYSWETISAGDQLIFWKKDEENGQVSFARLFPNSSVAIIAVDENTSRLSLDTYLSQIEYGEGSSLQTMSLNGLPYTSVHIAANGLQDSYFQLPNGKILILYTQTGDGPTSEYLKEEIRYMIGSVRGSDSSGEGDNCMRTTSSGISGQSTPLDEKRATVLKLVLLDDGATDALEVIDDEILFETDSIGIGTGPVEYYYSAEMDLTLKIDRDSDTLLATNEGKTSSF